MYTLRMLGGISLTDESGVEIDSLLRQPKHVALLAYLASPTPGTWHKRDSVLGTFWPENDQTRSRSSLRSALYTVRRHLPENAIRARGDNDLSVDPQIITSDTGAMSDFLERGEFAAALACYKGEFLPGIYIQDSDEFERWLEQERRRTRMLACQAARELSTLLESHGDIQGAIRAARRNCELDPDDEGTARRLIALLDAAGDRAQAFAVYEQFRNHLSDTFGVRPSAETVALLDAVRTRHEPGQLPLPSLSVSQPPATERADPLVAATPKRRRTHIVAFAAIPLAAAALAWTLWPREKPATITGAKTMVVLPVSNDTGDPSLDYLATGIGDDIARRLSEVGGFAIRSSARSIWSAKIRTDLRRIARAYNASFLLKLSVRTRGDSLQLSAKVVDGATLRDDSVATHAFSQGSIADVESRIAAAVAGAVFFQPLPPPDNHPVDPESYKLTLQGFHQMLVNVQLSSGKSSPLARETANELFWKAVNIDPSNARAWAGLSSVWASRTVTDQVPFDEGYERSTTAAARALALDSRQGTALANLGALEALKQRKVSAGLPFIRKAEVAEPSNDEVFLVKSALFRTAHRWDEARDAIRVARKLDPWTSLYIDREAVIEFCAGNPAKALRLYQEQSELDPSNGIIQGGITRALAMMNRYDEAIESWRRDARLQSDTLLLKELSGARGKEGYWNLRHDIGKRWLAALDKKQGRVSALNRMQASFAAGDSAQGFRLLDQVIASGISAMYRLPCMPDIDEFRDTDHFKAEVAKAGALPN